MASPSSSWPVPPGFAPVKSMLEHAFWVGLTRKMILYWGVRRPADMYLTDLVETRQREHSNFKFIPVVPDAVPEDQWTGRTGLVHEAILEDFPDFHATRCMPAVGGHGRPPRRLHRPRHFGDDCFSDAFHVHTYPCRRRRPDGQTWRRACPTKPTSLAACRYQCIAIQVLVLGGFAVFIGCFSSDANLPPARRQDNDAIAGFRSATPAQLKSACRERSAEEFLNSRPNMNQTPIARASGPSCDSNSTLTASPLHRIDLPPGGLHKGRRGHGTGAMPFQPDRIESAHVRQASGEFNYVKEAAVELAPGQVLLVDFLPAAGGSSRAKVDP